MTEVQNYEFRTISIARGQITKRTNPSYIAGWPSGLTTMAVIGGQINNSQPSFWTAYTLMWQFVQEHNTKPPLMKKNESNTLY